MNRDEIAANRNEKIFTIPPKQSEPNNPLTGIEKMNITWLHQE